MADTYHRLEQIFCTVVKLPSRHSHDQHFSQAPSVLSYPTTLAAREYQDD